MQAIQRSGINNSHQLRLISTTRTDFEKSYRPSQKNRTQAAGFTSISNNYCRGLKFSSSGDYLVTNSNDRTLRIFDLTNYCRTDQNPTFNDELSSVQQICENSIIYDFDLHPYADDLQQDSCLLVSASKQIPIHLWNYKTGTLLSSYNVRGQSEELEPVYCSTFAGFLGRSLLAGTRRYIALFDLERPGFSFSISDFAKECRRSDEDSHHPQDGIISCLAISPMDCNVFVAGSYGKHIGLYDMRKKLQPEHLLAGQNGGINYLKFSSIGHNLYSSGRNDHEILCWDMRNLGDIRSAYVRNSKTNQRITFDINFNDSFLVSGDIEGNLIFWDLNNGRFSSEPVIRLTKAHDDCLNAVSFHPVDNELFATVSGQRHFPTLIEDESFDNIFDDTYIPENSLKFWKFS